MLFPVSLTLNPDGAFDDERDINADRESYEPMRRPKCSTLLENPCVKKHMKTLTGDRIYCKVMILVA